MLIMGAVQGIFLSLHLIGARRRQYSPNWKLAGVFVALAIGYIGMSGGMLSDDQAFVHIFNMLMPAVTASVPLLYLYVKSIAYPPVRESKRDILHLLPLSALILYPLIFKTSAISLAGILLSANLWYQCIVRIIWAVYALPYIPLLRRLASFHARYILTLHCNGSALSGDLLDEINIHIWIRRLLTVSCAYWLFNIVLLAVPFSPLFAFISVSFIYAVNFMVLHKPLLFMEINTIHVRAAERNGGGQ